MKCILRRIGAMTALFATFVLGMQSAIAEDAPLRIGVITFLSGPAAGPFGVPAKNAADLMADVLNKGGQIPGYEKKGFGGRQIELVYVDEAGGPTKVVTEYRNLVTRQNVDMVIGVISSGDCLAVAPWRLTTTSAFRASRTAEGIPKTIANSKARRASA